MTDRTGASPCARTIRNQPSIAGAHGRAPLTPSPQPHRIAVLRPGALGDTILALPALARLQAAFPGSRLTFVGNAAVLPLLLSSGYVEVALSADSSLLAPLFVPLEAPAPPLADLFGDLDLAVLWLHESAVVAANLRRLGARAIVAAPSRPPAESRQHVADYLVSTLDAVLPDAPTPPRSFPMLASPSLPSSLSPTVAIHCGSGGRWKCWPAARFALLADLLAQQGMAVVLVAGPADEEVAADFHRALRVARPVLAAGLPLTELAAILAGCRAFVGNDSGISHLAAALGVPTVAIYGPTDPALWGVRGPRVAHVCGQRLEDVTVDEVAWAVERLLEER